MFVWRLPLFAFADLSVSAALVVVVSALAWARGRSRREVVRGLWSGAIVIAFLTAPQAVLVVTGPALAAQARHGTFIHPGFFVLTIPTISAALLLALARILFPSLERPGVTLKYRASFIAMLLGLALLNCANFCSPGWCERLGFPFAYSSWSDAVAIFDGENLTAGVSWIAAAADAGLAVLAVWQLWRSYRAQ